MVHWPMWVCVDLIRMQLVAMDEAEGAAEAETQAVKLLEQLAASGALRGFGNGRGVRRPRALRASLCLVRPCHATLLRGF
jgi:hypothetical protein